MTKKYSGFGRKSITIDGHKYIMAGTGTKKAFPERMGSRGPVYSPTVKLIASRLRNELGISVRVLPVTYNSMRTGPRYGLFVLKANFARARKFLFVNSLYYA